MSEANEIPKDIIEEIERYFGFLFDMGYVIDSVKIINRSWDAWEVVLKHQDFFLKFEEEKGGLDISFGSPSKGFMIIRALVYFLSKEKKFIGISILGGKKKDAKLLQKYINDFESSFNTEFPKSEEEVKLAEQKYFKKLGLGF